MSDRRELHQKVSETFEPKPDYIPRITGSISGVMNFLDRPSVTTAWRYEWKWEQKPDAPPNDFTDLVNSGSWHPLEWDADEVANARLLEAMPLPMLSRQDPSREWLCSVNEQPGEEGEFIELCRPDRKIAIVDAYAAWKQLA